MGIWRLVALAALGLAASGCVKLTIAWTNLSPKGPDAAPSVLDAAALGSTESDDVATIADWRDATPAIKEALQRYVYGALPDASRTDVAARRVIADRIYGDKGRLEELQINASARFGDADAPWRAAAPFSVSLVTPADATGPAPLIMMETFCSREAAIPYPEPEKPRGGIMFFVFGRYICTPPIEEILSAGYALAVFHPPQFVPDAADAGLAALSAISPDANEDAPRWGAIAAWAWGYSRVVDALDDDPRLDANATVAWGHSRYGKAALLAAAFDERIDGVIAHQSGTGGASLNREKRGESVGEITEAYPHWFAETYAAFAGREAALPIDQHHLLALIAPRPMLLGNARRDVWSDPNGAFRAAMGADPIYELYGSRGLDQERLKPFNPAADISFWIRPGTHGVVEEDWPAFLAFLRAHFPSQATAGAAVAGHGERHGDHGRDHHDGHHDGHDDGPALR